MSRPVVVIGFGGHGRVVAAALTAAGRRVVAAVDPAYLGRGEELFDLEIIDDRDLLKRFPPSAVDLALGIGSIGVCGVESKRHTLSLSLQQVGYLFTTVRHPFSWVSPDAIIDQGAQVHAGAVVQPGARIGGFSIINTAASVDHDCEIGAFCHLAPRVVLSGNVRVGAGSHLGTGSSVIQGVSIGSGCFVAAGATVTADIADRVSVKGLPAKPF